MIWLIASFWLLLATIPLTKSNNEFSIEVEDLPILDTYDVNPCEGASRSNVTRLRTDVWIISNNYSQCRDSSKLKILRVHTMSDNATMGNPLVFVTRMGSSVQTWQLPLRPQTFYDQYSSFSRTICSNPSSENSSLDFPVYMDVFTSSLSTVEYSFEVDLVQGFELDLEKKVEFTVSPTDSHVFYFNFPDGVSSVRVVVSNTTKARGNCAIVSVQNASCPVNDQLENARSKGAYQTMTTSASLTVTARDTVKGRDFFVVVVAANSSVCNKLRELNRDMLEDGGKDGPFFSFELVVEEMKPASQYKSAIALPVIIFLILGFLMLLLFLCPCLHCYYRPLTCHNCFKVKLNMLSRVSSSWPVQAYNNIDDEIDQCNTSVNACTIKRQMNNNSPDDVEMVKRVFVSSEHTSSQHEKMDSEPDGEDERTQLLTSITSYGSTGGMTKGETLATPSLEHPFQQSGFFRGLLDKKENCVMLPDLMKSGYNSLENRYKVYGWSTLTVGIFYALPAFQLVFSEQLILNANGDQDTCYYNFKCAHPYSALSAFNSVWSNIGYFILGLSFLGVVAVRNYKVNRAIKKGDNRHQTHGVPQFFGIYYAMGFALVMEGFMSAFYHICPSDNNFQFDTAFMFIIGGLMIIKVLQSRHPDVHANAFIAFLCFAVVIFFTLIGIWEWSKAYWQTNITLGFLALIGITTFAISFYYYHDWRPGYWIEKETYVRIFRWFRSWCVLCNSKEKFYKLLPKHPYRFIKVVVLVALNIFVGIYLVSKYNKIASTVLGLFISNFLLLIFLYIICKFRYREPITLMPVVCLVSLGIFWGCGFYFYLNNVTQWKLSPAESREMNRDCIALGFYDNHDIWHFFSAAAMFFSFLFLLTLDDGTEILERHKIHVF